MKTILITALMLGCFATHAKNLPARAGGNKFNPAIGLNALTLFKNTNRGAETDGVSIQEVELQFSSDIDAYLRGEVTIGMHQEHGHGHGHSHGFTVEPEEAFVETLSLPYITLKLGKFYADFGKYNAVHSHAQPFIYRGKLQETMFGDEGLAQSGVSASFLVPTSWFSEVTVQFLQPSNEEVFEHSHHKVAYVARWKNLWELSNSLTMELGVSSLYFKSHAHERGAEDHTGMYGADLTFKWRPVKKGNSASFMWSTEYIQKERSGGTNEKNGGISSFVRYQLDERWFAQGQYEYLGFGKSKNLKDLNAYTGLIAFVPTEFSSVRAQYDRIYDGGHKPEIRLSLQLNISIGAHPAHSY